MININKSRKRIHFLNIKLLKKIISYHWFYVSLYTVKQFKQHKQSLIALFYQKKYIPQNQSYYKFISL